VTGHRADADVRWDLNGAGSWRILDLDDVRVLFQYPAGKTHFLNASSAFILDLLAEAPVSFRGILDALSEELGVQPTTSQITQLGNHLERLEALGLIAQCRPPSE